MNDLGFELSSWLLEFTEKCSQVFSERLLFMGLQGSCNRQEANRNSDIDLVILLDELELEDLEQYRKIIQSMTHSEKACGFICGKEELKHWPKYDLFHLYYDTSPIRRNLEDVIEKPDIENARQALKIGAANFYHAACHSYLYAKEQIEAANVLKKNIQFILQAKYFYENGVYLATKTDLKKELTGEDREIFLLCNTELSGQTAAPFFQCLIHWCKEQLK